MKVLRVSFVGTRTDSFDATLSLFRDVLGMAPAFAHPGWAGFHLPSGERDLLEVFGRPDIDTRVVPSEFEGGVLIALAVDDVVRARQEACAPRSDCARQRLDLRHIGSAHGEAPTPRQRSPAPALRSVKC